jgi:hypothetical protein
LSGQDNVAARAGNGAAARRNVELTSFRQLEQKRTGFSSGGMTPFPPRRLPGCLQQTNEIVRIPPLGIDGCSNETSKPFWGGYAL